MWHASTGDGLERGTDLKPCLGTCDALLSECGEDGLFITLLERSEEVFLLLLFL